MKDNYYYILGLDPSASALEIRAAYRKLAKKYHPDRDPGNPKLDQKFKRINEAYQTLKNPSKKASYDNWLKYGGDSIKTGEPYTRYTYRRQPYPGKRGRARRRYNQGTMMFGKIFVLLLILMVICIPVSLYYFSSEYNYNKGEEYLKQEDYSSALVYFRRAMVIFGAKSAEAGIKAGRIEQEIMNDHIDAIIFCNEALEFAEKNKTISEILFVRAKSYIQLKYFEQAKDDLKESIKHNQTYDSAYFLLGELNTLVFEEYEEGLTNFDQLLDINSDFNNGYFARAYCYQKLGEHQKAIEDFELSIIQNQDNGQAFYFKAISELSLNQVDIACHDLYIAKTMGVKDADAIISINCGKLSDATNPDS